MKIWIDAQLSPAIATWINHTFSNMEAASVRTLGLRDASDHEIFRKAREKKVVIMSKDRDFLNLIQQYGSPPKFIWITCGNTSNEKMKEILYTTLTKAKDLLEEGEAIVEISDKIL